MNTAAVCIIGSELVRGVIQDSHGKTISSDLTSAGYTVQEICIVPDDGSIRAVLGRLVDHVDLIITTGGLGPTSDDITRDAVASVYHADLREDPAAKKTLRAIVGDRMNEANLRQAMIPEGFSILPNAAGTAPGFCLEGKIYTLPGPPREKIGMWQHEVLPRIHEYLGNTGKQQRMELSVFLTPESQLEEVCAKAVETVMERIGCERKMMPDWGTRVQPYRISLYLQGSVSARRQEVYELICELLGPGRIVPGDVHCTDIVRQTLSSRGHMVSGAESCTGGLVGKLITDAPGSSSYFWGSAVTYSNEAKKSMLSVSEQTLRDYGAVSERCALEMAEGIRAVSGSDVAFSISGIAGPGGGTDEKPVGTVWFGFSGRLRESSAVRLAFHPFSRDSVRRRAATALLLLLDAYLKGEDLLDIVGEWQYI